MRIATAAARQTGGALLMMSGTNLLRQRLHGYHRHGWWHGWSLPLYERGLMNAL